MVIMDNIKLFKEELQNLYEENKVKQIFEELKEVLDKRGEKYKEFLELIRQFNDLQDEKNAEKIDFQSVKKEMSSIAQNLFDFFNALDEVDFKHKKDETKHKKIYNNILVLTAEEEIEIVSDFFYQLNFINVDIKSTRVFPSSMFDKYDIIIFDNTDLKPCRKKEDLKAIREKSTEDCVLIQNRVEKMDIIIKETSKRVIHYGGLLYWVDYNRGRVQAANSKFSLYARTREVIEFINTYRA